MAAKRRRLGQVDLDTGEVMAGVVVHLPTRRHMPYGDSWLTTYQPPWVGLATDPDITLITWRIIGWAISNLGWSNWIDCSPTKIGKVLGIARPNVPRQLTLLATKNVLISGGRCHKGCRRYRLNPAYAWRGRAGDLAAALEPATIIGIRKHTKTTQESPDGV